MDYKQAYDIKINDNKNNTFNITFKDENNEILNVYKNFKIDNNFESNLKRNISNNWLNELCFYESFKIGIIENISINLTIESHNDYGVISFTSTLSIVTSYNNTGKILENYNIPSKELFIKFIKQLAKMLRLGRVHN